MLNNVIFKRYLEIKNKFKWGDENYYALRLKEDIPIGMIFKGRLKNKVYTIIMVGLYPSDHSLMTDLVIPKLQYINTPIDRKHNGIVFYCLD